LENKTLNSLLSEVDEVVNFVIDVEFKQKNENFTNVSQVSQQIKEKLKDLISQPNRTENPVIYHLDVAAMYPNIILTNRLQPSAIVTAIDCSSCDFNTPENKCQRNMVKNNFYFIFFLFYFFIFRIGHGEEKYFQLANTNSRLSILNVCLSNMKY
jgi:DNA polymerase elongation subunit (family B)